MLTKFYKRIRTKVQRRTKILNDNNKSNKISSLFFVYIRVINFDNSNKCIFTDDKSAIQSLFLCIDNFAILRTYVHK